MVLRLTLRDGFVWEARPDLRVAMARTRRQRYEALEAEDHEIPCWVAVAKATVDRCRRRIVPQL